MNLIKSFKILLFVIFNFSFGFSKSSGLKNEDQKKVTGKKMEKSKDTKDGEACTLPQNEEALKKLLSPEQYRITRLNGTEAPFQNKYWNNKHPGIYVDVISAEALFTSKDKFDSGTGWPSFTKPIIEDRVQEKKDISHGMERIEVRSKKANSHLGHVFNDGPGENGLRYCINSASLKFIPLEKFEEMGYQKYLPLFSNEELEKSKKNPYKD